MINIDKNNKLAFSLFETLVVMSIVAVFVAASANVFTKKRTRIAEKTPHGRFECYYNGSTLRQQYFVENLSKPVESVTVCKFKPIKNAPYYIVNLVGGGGAGSSSSAGNGGGAGEYRSFFVTHIEKELQITPGKGSTNSSTSGDESIVKSVESSGTKTIASVNGGTYGFNKSTMNGDSVSSCDMLEAKYVCSREPVCHAYKDYVQVSYCKEDDLAGENESTAFVTENLQFKDINSSTVLSGDTLTYTKTGTIYKFALTVKANMGKGEDISEFNTYLKAIGVNSGIISATPGNGGAQGQPGKHGGAVIIW